MKLVEIIKEIRSGAVLSRIKQSSKEPEGKTCKVITIRSLGNGNGIEEDLLEKININDVITNRHLSAENDVILRLSYPFTAVVIKSSTRDLVIPSNLCILRGIDKKVLPEYLCIFLNSSIAKKQFSVFTSQSTIPTIKIGMVGEIDIEIPPLETQQKVINFENTYRKRKELLEQLIIEEEKVRNFAIKTIIKKESQNGNN